MEIFVIYVILIVILILSLLFLIDVYLNSHSKNKELFLFLTVALSFYSIYFLFKIFNLMGWFLNNSLFDFLIIICYISPFIVYLGFSAFSLIMKKGKAFFIMSIIFAVAVLFNIAMIIAETSLMYAEFFNTLIFINPIMLAASYSYGKLHDKKKHDFFSIASGCFLIIFLMNLCIPVLGMYGDVSFEKLWTFMNLFMTLVITFAYIAFSYSYNTLIVKILRIRKKVKYSNRLVQFLSYYVSKRDAVYMIETVMVDNGFVNTDTMTRDDKIAFVDEVVDKYLIKYYSEQKSSILKTKLFATLEVDLNKNPFVPGEKDLDF
jgi:hypothetical protein